MMTTVENRFQDALFSAIEILMIPRVKMATKSANASPRRSVHGKVLEANQRVFRLESKAYMQNKGLK